MTKIQVRRGTTAQWASAATVLAAGEPGQDTDTGVIKVGDGTTAWASLLPTGGPTQAIRVVDATSSTLTGTLAAGHLTPVDATAGAAARTLPAAASVAAGGITAVKKADTGANAVTVNRAGSDLIFGTGSGATSKTLTLAGEAVTFVSDGVSKWTVQASDTPSGVLASTYLTQTAATSTYAPILSANGLSALAALAERDALTGAVPPRMATAPTVIGPTKGSGITGTPTVSAGGSGYIVGDQITLAGGTALSAAILQVATLSGSAVATVTVVRNGVYTATPSNAVAQASTTGSGTGATFTVSWSAAGFSTALSRAHTAANTASFRFTGTGSITNESSSGYYGSALNGVHTSFEWSTDSQHVDVRLIGLSTAAVLYVNGQQVSSAALSMDASGTAYMYSLDLGSATLRNFKLLGYNMALAGVYIDGTATFQTAPLAYARPLAWSLGDSYTLGTGAENAGTSHICVMADALGLDMIPSGISSTGWNSASSNIPATRVTAYLGALTRVPDYVFFDLGYNDAGGNMTTAAAAFDAAVTAAKAVAPSAKYFAFAAATPLGRTTNLDLVTAMISARCTANSVRFIDVSDWVNSTNKTIYTGGDNAHPTVLGHKYLGARRAAAIKPYL